MSPADNNPKTTRYEQPGGSVLPTEAERRLKEDAGAAFEAARREIKTVKAEAEAQAGAVVEQAKEEIGKVAETAKGMASEQKEFLASQVDDVAAAVSKVANELEGNNAVGGYARTLAETVQNFSETLKNKDIDELLGMAQDFGRRQPVLFMGAMALMGFAASRFIMASAKGNRGPANMGSQYAGSGVGDGGISGNYPGPSRRGSGDDLSSMAPRRDNMGGSV
jgi:hypothetical protein